jgi:rubrerythrin
MNTTEPATPSCHDAVTTACPICQRPFTPVGRQRYCSDACRAAAYRRRRDANRPTLHIPNGRRRRPITVYECDDCGFRALGDQRCPDCSTFMRKIGLGGDCPHCGEPVAVPELLAQEVTATN